METRRAEGFGGGGAVKGKRFEVAVLVLAAVTCVLLATDAWPGLRGPEAWRWGRRIAIAPLPLLGAVVTFLAMVGVAGALRRAGGTVPASRRAGLITLAAALILGQMLFLTAAEPGGLSHLSRRVEDASFTSYHTIARSVDDPRAFLRDYHRLQSRFPVHGPSQPPGRVLFFWAVNHAAGDPQRGAFVAALLLLGAGALVVVPLASIAGIGRGPEGATSAAGALLLFASVPSILLFTPETDHLILLLTVTAAALLFAALRRASVSFAIAGGFVAGVSLFVSLTSAAALGAWGLALVLEAASMRDRPPASRLSVLVLSAGAALFAALAIPAALGMNWPAVARECIEGAHRVQVQIFHRSHSEWVVWNLVDFALFLGPPLAFAVFASIRSPFAIALVAALAVLDLSGTILGETGRIWMFLMPLAVLAVATSRAADPRFDRALLVLAAAQFAVLMTMRMTLNVPG